VLANLATAGSGGDPAMATCGGGGGGGVTVPNVHSNTDSSNKTLLCQALYKVIRSHERTSTKPSILRSRRSW